MNRRLVVTPLARRELVEAFDWYEIRRPGLGENFIQSFQAAAAAIVENPFQYQVFGRNARRAGLHGFPYGLIYTISDTDIVIVACFHGSRNPKRWQG